MSPRDDFRHQVHIELVDLANSIDEHVSQSEIVDALRELADRIEGRP